MVQYKYYLHFININFKKAGNTPRNLIDLWNHRKFLWSNRRKTTQIPLQACKRLPALVFKKIFLMVKIHFKPPILNKLFRIFKTINMQRKLQNKKQMFFDIKWKQATKFKQILLLMTNQLPKKTNKNQQFITTTKKEKKICSVKKI